MNCRLLLVVFIITGVMANHNHEREPRILNLIPDTVWYNILYPFNWMEPWCNLFAGSFCKEVVGDWDIYFFTITKKIGCGMQNTCQFLNGLFDQWYPKGKIVPKGRSLDIGHSMDQAHEARQLMVIGILQMATELEEGIKELEQEINKTQIKKLYGDDLDLYFSIRKKFNSIIEYMNITREGGISRDERFKYFLRAANDFLRVANDKENGLKPIFDRIYLMLVGTSRTPSLFKALPESCNQLDFFVPVIIDSALLGNFAMALTEKKVPNEADMLKNAIDLINSQFVTDCGYPPDTVEKAQSNLTSLIWPLINTNKSGEVEEL